MELRNGFQLPQQPATLPNIHTSGFGSPKPAGPMPGLSQDHHPTFHTEATEFRRPLIPPLQLRRNIQSESSKTVFANAALSNLTPTAAMAPKPSIIPPRNFRQMQIGGSERNLGQWTQPTTEASDPAGHQREGVPPSPTYFVPHAPQRKLVPPSQSHSHFQPVPISLPGGNGYNQVPQQLSNSYGPPQISNSYAASPLQPPSLSYAPSPLHAPVNSSYAPSPNQYPSQYARSPTDLSSQGTHFSFNDRIYGHQQTLQNQQNDLPTPAKSGYPEQYQRKLYMPMQPQYSEFRTMGIPINDSNDYFQQVAQMLMTINTTGANNPVNAQPTAEPRPRKVESSSVLKGIQEQTRKLEEISEAIYRPAMKKVKGKSKALEKKLGLLEAHLKKYRTVAILLLNTLGSLLSMVARISHCESIRKTRRSRFAPGMF